MLVEGDDDDDAARRRGRRAREEEGFLFGEVENLSREGEGDEGRRRGREERSMERTAGDREVPGEVPAGEERARGDVR